MRTLPAVALFIVASTAMRNVVLAQPIHWIGGSGNWTDAANWEGGNIPDEVTESVVFNGNTPYVVSKDRTHVIGDLALETASPHLQLHGGSGLLVLSGNITNNGTITVNPTGIHTPAYIQLNNDGTIDGTGTVILDAFAWHHDAQITHFIHEATTTFGPNQTLRGFGLLSGNAFVFQGTVAPGGWGRRIYAGATLEFTPTSRLEIEIDTNLPYYESTAISCSRSVSLNGTLAVNLINGYVPARDREFVIMTGSPITGTFDNVIFPPNSGGRIRYESNSLFDSVVVYFTCDSIDFNNDGSTFDPQDIDAFLSVYSEGPCVPVNATCNDIDFNNDTSVFDPQDIASFLSVYGEGPCL